MLYAQNIKRGTVLVTTLLKKLFFGKAISKKKYVIT